MRSATTLASFLFVASILNAQKIATFDVPGGIDTEPMAISSSGLVVGFYGEPNATKVRGFLRDNAGKITTFDVSGMNTEPTAVNAAGQITGVYTLSPIGEPPFHSFLRQPDGTIVTFDAPNASDTRATTIDERGEISGFALLDEQEGYHAFLRDRDGDITTFEVSGAFNTYPLAVNAKGQMIGWWTAANIHGFLRDAEGSVTDIDVPATFGSATTPTAINAKGEIVGIYYPLCPPSPEMCDSPEHAFLREPDGSYITFDAPNATSTTATTPDGIDSRGEIAGVYSEIAGISPLLSFMRKTDGSITTFDIPNATFTDIAAMNAAGQITGDYEDKNGVHGFVITR